MEANNESLPDWKAPKVQAVVRLTNGEVEDKVYEVEEAWTDDETSEGEDEREMARPGTSKWQNISYPIPIAKIKRVKHKYHPSSKVGIMDELWDDDLKYNCGEWYTDSGHEGGMTTNPLDWDDEETWNW